MRDIQITTELVCSFVWYCWHGGIVKLSGPICNLPAATYKSHRLRLNSSTFLHTQPATFTCFPNRYPVVRMSHCHDEHDHHHHHGDEHDHSDDITPALQFSLYQHIDFDNITTLNESVHGSGKAITKKEWAERLSDQPEVASDADEQLIINIP